MTISRSKMWAALAVGAFLAPTAMRAQDTAPTPQTDTPAGRTHVVRAGDTLWDLARTYIGDPFLWPEIYRLNTGVVEDPHWIYPGEELRLPGDANAPVASGEEEVSSAGPTTFAMGAAARRGDSGARRAMMGRTARPLIRAGEYYAAPWVDRESGPVGAGSILGRVDMPGIAQVRSHERLQIGDRLNVTAPSTRPAAEGARYLALADGPTLDGQGRIFIPTGVLVVERSAVGGAPIARVVTSYDQMKIGQKLVPFDSIDFPAGVMPAAIELGPTGTVLWVKGGNILTSLQQYLIVDQGERAGIRMGDQFTLVRKKQRNANGVMMSEEPIAVATVVRVSPGASTAIIVGQMQPAIREGVPARLTAKAP